MAALDKVIDLAAAVAEHVRDGMVAALKGFGHLIPFAAAHQIIRQGRRDLTLCRLTPDLVITPLAVLSRPDKFGELMISEVHPGLTVDDVQDATLWDIPVADDVRVTARPTEDVRLLDDTAGRPGRSPTWPCWPAPRLGTLASTLINAPINVIAHELGATPRGIVLAVSTFTLAMMLFAPPVVFVALSWALAGPAGDADATTPPFPGRFLHDVR